MVFLLVAISLQLNSWEVSGHSRSLTKGLVSGSWIGSSPEMDWFYFGIESSRSDIHLDYLLFASKIFVLSIVETGLLPDPCVG